MKKENIIGKREIIFIFLLAVLLLALRLPHMFDPLNREEGIFAYTAGLTLSGGVPYKDVFDNNTPFIFYIYRAAFEMAGKNAEAIRNFTSVYVIFSMLLIYMLARTFGRASTAMMASLFYVIFLNNGYMNGFTSSTGIFTHFTAVFALFFLLDRDKTYENANFFLSGFLLSTAVFTDPVMLAVFFVPVAYILVFIKEKKRAVRGILWYLAGFLCVAGLAVLWSVKNGIFNEFFDAVVVYNLKTFIIIQKTRMQGAIFAGAGAFASANLFLSAAFVYSMAGLLNKKNDQLNFALTFTTLAVITGIIMFKGTEPHDYAIILPYLSLMAAFMLKDGFDSAAKNGKKGVYGVVLIAVLVLMEMIYGFYITFNKPHAAEAKTYTFLEARDVAARVNAAEKSVPDIFVWPNDPEIYFYTGSRAGHRMVNAANYSVYKDEFRRVIVRVYSVRPEYMVLEKGSSEKLFENMLKTYYSKILEGEKLVLYKKGEL